jgi:excisionase family DNA binding protein
MGREREPLVSLAEVAAYLGLPPATLHQWRYRGVGPVGYRVGRHVRYRMSEVDRWLEAQADRQSSLK